MTNKTTIQCPGCGTTLEWSSKNPHRPFCSEQCRNRDFIDWANEEKKIPGDPDYHDLLSEDSEQLH